MLEYKSNKISYYMGISLFGFLILVVIFVTTLFFYSGEQCSFAPYDPTSNPYTSNPGLQYMSLQNNAPVFIDSNSTTTQNKELMINRALTELNSSGIDDGYINTTNDNTSYNVKLYFVLIFIFLLTIMGLILYNYYDSDKYESNKLNVDNMII